MSDNLQDLVARLRERARVRVALALFANSPLKVEDTEEWQAADAIERMEKLRQDGETITERYMQFASLHNDREDYLIAKDYNARFIDAAKGER